jgi:O-antigen ligase
MSLELAIPIGTRALLACSWLGRRWPTLFLAIVLASFAIGPQWVLARALPNRLLALAIPAQQLLLIAAFAANAVRYGVRPGLMSWPLVAVLLLLAQSALLADPDPQLTSARMAIAALGLALPWCLAAVLVEPGTRVRYALVIALLPGLCVAIGFGLQAAGLHAAYTGSAHRVLRLHGASNAGWLVCLALTGFAVALHEAIRGRHGGLACLAVVNLVVAVLTGGRMGVGAGALFTVAYCLLDDGLRARLRRARWPLIGLGAATAVLLLGWLILQSYHDPEDSLDMSGRDTLWAHYFKQFLERPAFGHGIGATGLIANYFKLPHNVYLRLLVEVGVVGCLLYGGAILLWGRQVIARVDPSERAFVYALWLALAVYALTDNLLTMPPTLMPFVYLALMLGEPYPARPDPEAGAAAPGAPPLRDALPASPGPAPGPPRSAPCSSSGR